LYTCKELLFGLAGATQSETDPIVKDKIKMAQIMTVICWCTYPMVYLFPMLGISASHSVNALTLSPSAALVC
jgi:hypothetical protein